MNSENPSLFWSIYRKRLLTLADAIEKEDPIKFNIRSFGEKIYHPCQTTGCIAGFAVLLFKGREEFEQGVQTNRWITDVAEVLRLDEGIMEQLFWPPHWQTRNYSPQEAARTLRHLAKTGVVFWDCE